MDGKELRLFHENGPYNKKDPRSLYNIMPKECRNVLDEMPLSFLTMDESHLEGLIKPTPYLNQLRIAFWQEYDTAQNTLTSMTMRGIQSHMGSGSPSILMRDYMTDEKTLAWVLIPPTHYDALVDEALSRGMRRIQQIIDLPMMKPDGTIDHASVALVMKAVAFLDIRKHGMPTQHTTQDIRQLSVNLTKKDVKALGLSNRSEELDFKIKALEEKLKVEHS
jgi:hypothetical protein